jgi:hypothetical protein
MDGELIAVEFDTVFVLTESGLQGIFKPYVNSAKLTSYWHGAGGLAGWTFLGIISTASHGIGLILTAPVWLIVGASATAAQTYAPQEKLRDQDWEKLSKFARFPQGLPSDIDRSSIRGKTVL